MRAREQKKKCYHIKKNRNWNFEKYGILVSYDFYIFGFWEKIFRVDHLVALLSTHTLHYSCPVHVGVQMLRYSTGFNLWHVDVLKKMKFINKFLGTRRVKIEIDFLFLVFPNSNTFSPTRRPTKRRLLFLIIFLCRRCGVFRLSAWLAALLSYSSF